MKILEFLKHKINTVCARYLNEDNEIEYLPYHQRKKKNT